MTDKGKFGKFLGGKGGSTPPGTSVTVGPATGGAAKPATTALATTSTARLAAYAAAGAAGPVHKTAGKFALVFDGTASMEPLFERAVQELVKIAHRLSTESSGVVTLQIFVYRDYEAGSRLLEVSEPMTDASKLALWLGRVRCFTAEGGDYPEAAEAGLAEALKVGGFDAVLLAGDAPSHHRSYLNGIGRPELKTAHELALEFKGKGVPVHTFVVGGDPNTASDFEIIATNSGGVTGSLDTGDSSMVDMAVTAMLAMLGGKTAVQDYLAKYQRGMTPAALAFAGNLLRITKS